MAAISSASYQQQLLTLALALLALCFAGSSSVAVYDYAPADADAHCRVGYYIHDSADFVYSATVCPPKLDCRRARPDVLRDEIRCKMEHLGSPREFPYLLDHPSYSARNVFRFSCARESTECGDGQFCYRSSAALQLAKDDTQYFQLTQPSDAAVICA